MHTYTSYIFMHWFFNLFGSQIITKSTVSFLWYPRSIECKGEGIQLAGHTFFQTVLQFKNSFLKVLFYFLFVFFLYHINYKTDFFYIIKKIHLYCRYLCIQKKCICLALFSLIFFLFILHNNLRCIFTSEKYFLFKWNAKHV